jgi:GT2 family glycosyltransferase
MGATDHVPMTVIIPTRNRGDRILKTLETILRNNYGALDVRVVDQSDDDRTEVSLRPLLNDPRIAYIRTSTKGISAALNVGIGDAQAEFIAITGDDCEVDEQWLNELLAAFALDRRIGIVFGNVLPCAHEPDKGFVPGYIRADAVMARGIHEKHRVAGTSACMGIRRSVWQALDGFDPLLGVGALLKAGEDTDIVVRALLRGYFVCETPRVIVTHHGVYEPHQRRLVLHNYWFGTGAALVKPLKLGHWSIALVLMRLAWIWLFGGSRIAATLGERPHRLARLSAFVTGFAAGAVIRVDHRTGRYRRDPSDPRALPASNARHETGW